MGNTFWIMVYHWYTLRIGSKFYHSYKFFILNYINWYFQPNCYICNCPNSCYLIFKRRIHSTDLIPMMVQVNHILAAIKRKKSMDTIILSLVASICTFLIFIYWLTKWVVIMFLATVFSEVVTCLLFTYSFTGSTSSFLIDSICNNFSQ